MLETVGNSTFTKVGLPMRYLYVMIGDGTCDSISDTGLVGLEHNELYLHSHQSIHFY